MSMDKTEVALAQKAEAALNEYYKCYCVDKDPRCMKCLHNLGSHCAIKEAIRTIGQRVYLES